MIPAKHWHDNGDGTAWWLVRQCPEPRAQQSAHTDCDVGATILAKRGEFCAQVENGYPGWLYEKSRQIRASVVAVLPIGSCTEANDWDCGVPETTDHICMSPNRVGGVDGRDEMLYIGGECDYLDGFPPAADGGMWAVKVALARHAD